MVPRKRSEAPCFWCISMFHWKKLFFSKKITFKGDLYPPAKEMITNKSKNTILFGCFVNKASYNALFPGWCIQIDSRQTRYRGTTQNRPSQWPCHLSGLKERLVYRGNGLEGFHCTEIYLLYSVGYNKLRCFFYQNEINIYILYMYNSS